MKLIILRHGKAQEYAPSMRDRDRELADRGREKIKTQTELIAKHLKNSDSIKIVSSPAARTTQTAKILADGLGINSETIDYYEDIYFGDINKNLEIINTQFEHGHDTVILSGHMPNVSYIAMSLTGDNFGFKTGSFLVLEKEQYDKTWKFIAQEL